MAERIWGFGGKLKSFELADCYVHARSSPIVWDEILESVASTSPMLEILDISRHPEAMLRTPLVSPVCLGRLQNLSYLDTLNLSRLDLHDEHFFNPSSGYAWIDETSVDVFGRQ